MLFVLEEGFSDCGVKVGMFAGRFVGRAPGVLDVGKGAAVFVGRAVGRGVSVGGTGVAVGTAA